MGKDDFIVVEYWVCRWLMTSAFKDIECQAVYEVHLTGLKYTNTVHRTVKLAMIWITYQSIRVATIIKSYRIGFDLDIIS